MEQNLSDLCAAAIVGAGASGIISVLHILEENPNGGPIVLIDECPPSRWGNGLAYATPFQEHLLNVPADRMGAYARAPRDFLEWTQIKHPELQNSLEAPFFPRAVYGEYLRERLQQALRNSGRQLKHIQARALRIEYRDKFWFIETTQDSCLSTSVVLATGYSGIQRPPFVAALPRESCLDCYDFAGLEKISSKESVLIVGTGLSAIDCWRSLRQRKHSGKISFLSRHGIFPQPLVPTARSRKMGSLAGMTPRSLFNLVRNLEAAKPGDPDNAWIYLALREQFQNIWQTWSQWERRQYSEHIEPLWRVLRHRTPAGNWEQIHQEIGLGRSEIIRGRILGAQKIGASQLTVTVRERGHQQTRDFSYDRIFLATGPQIARDLKIKSAGDLRHEPQLWRIGPASRDSLGEVSAIAEIREQARVLAQQMHQVSANTGLMSWHPEEQGESYLQHLRAALKLWRKSNAASLKLLVHALLPFLFTSSASDELRQLSIVLGRRRNHSVKRQARIHKPKAEAQRSKKLA